MRTSQCQPLLVSAALLLCLQHCLVPITPVTQAEIDKRVSDIQSMTQWTQHYDPCLLYWEINQKIKDLQEADPTNAELRDQIYNELENVYFCDHTKGLECDQDQKRCLCSGKNAYWQPDEPSTDKRRIGNCYLPYKSPCSPFVTTTKCGPGGECKFLWNEVKRVCGCKALDESDPACVAYKNQTLHEAILSDKFYELVGKLEKFDMASYHDACIGPPLTHFNNDRDSVWDLWQFVLDQESSSGSPGFPMYCNIFKSLHCINGICQCWKSYLWDDESRTCGGFRGARCDLDFHTETANFKLNFSCKPGWKCMGMELRPERRFEEVDSNAPRPLGCCSTKNLTGLLELPPDKKDKKDRFFPDRIHWTCPNRVVGAGTPDSYSCHVLRIAIIGAIICQLVLA